jgi:hypothetical protein
VSDIDTAAADSLKVLDPKRPIREADIKNWRIYFSLLTRRLLVAPAQHLG